MTLCRYCGSDNVDGLYAAGNSWFYRCNECGKIDTRRQQVRRGFVVRRDGSRGPVVECTGEVDLAQPPGRIALL